jgi:hypothetical protein
MRSLIRRRDGDSLVGSCKVFGLKRFFEKKTGVTRLSSDSIAEEAARKAAAFIADMDKAIIADMHRSGYALADPANNLSLEELVAIHEAERQVDIKVDVQRVAPATITFDPDTNRATDAVSGMAVEYVADDYPLERGEFWKLIWKSCVHDFRVDVDDGYSRMTQQNPDLSTSERSELMSKLNLKEYNGPMARSADATDFLSNIDLFLDLFAVVTRNRLKSRNIEIIFRPWGVETRYYRHLKFAPLKPAE